MAYRNVLTAREVATAAAGGIGLSLLMDPFLGMIVAAIVLAFYEQRKRKRLSPASTGKSPAVTDTNETGQLE